MRTLYFTIFWMIGILWAAYHWYWSSNRANINKSKAVFDFNSNRSHSTSSIESLEHSDNESLRKEYNSERRKNMQKLNLEIKTRWPSETSIERRSYKSF